MKKYVAFDFSTDGYIKMFVLKGSTKYDVADKFHISRNNVYQYDLIISVFKWLYNNRKINFYYFFKDSTSDYLYLYNRIRGQREPVRKMVIIKNAIKAYYNR